MVDDRDHEERGRPPVVSTRKAREVARAPITKRSVGAPNAPAQGMVA